MSREIAKHKDFLVRFYSRIETAFAKVSQYPLEKISTVGGQDRPRLKRLVFYNSVQQRMPCGQLIKKCSLIFCLTPDRNDPALKQITDNFVQKVNSKDVADLGGLVLFAVLLQFLQTMV